MIRQLAIGVVPLVACASAASAQTQVITGDQGFNRQVLEDAELYDATDATVLVEQGRNNTGYNIVGSPRTAMFLGGRTLGRGINRTREWDFTHGQGNGACVRFEDSPEFTVRRHYGEFCWDGLKPAGASSRPVIEEVWLRHIRDDAIEHDHVNSMDDPTLRISRSYLDSVHTFLSVTPGGGSDIQRRVRVEFHDNVMSLGCGLDDDNPCEDRDKRLKYAWARPIGSGQAFKVRGCGEEIDMLFRGNAVMMGLEETPDGWREVGFNTAGSNLSIFQCMNVLPGSTDNTFYWLGGCDFRGLEMEQVDGACVPKQFKLDPAVWTHVSNDRDAWEAEVARWRGEVWEGVAPPPADEDDDGGIVDDEDDGDDGEIVDEDDGDDGEIVDEDDGDDGEIVVAVDVRPEQCPSRVPANKNRNIPVVVVGTPNFDVRDIVAESIRLVGVPPKHDRTRYRDRATPYEPSAGTPDANDCTREGPDGREDLLLRFSSQSVGKALPPVADGATIIVELTGELEDGRRFRGRDVVVVLK